ncbi:MAG TPA: DUF3352 domain-containing protein [Frankiaceae bacterium]|nr:DUF3352 domain-containing protein [Frankiaceae bacterium]
MSDQTPGGTPGGTPGDEPPYAAPAGGGYGAGYGGPPMAGSTEYAGVGPEQRGGSKRGLIIGASAAVLAVVAGAAVWATTTLSGGGRQPDDLAPKSTFAYVKIDLDPAANQKLAARSFFAKFPALRDKTGDEENVFEDVLASLIEGGDLDYDRDLRPWFDKRAGLAAFRDGAGRPQVVGILRSKDDEQARRSLEQVRARNQDSPADFAFAIDRGYAVVGEQAAVDDAVRLSEKESLSDNEFYTGDVDRLGGDQVAVAWANLPEAVEAVKNAVPFAAAAVPGLVTQQVKGRFVAGVHLTGDYAELQGLAIGMDPRTVPKVTAATDLLTSLPDDTVAAVSLSGLATGTRQADQFFDLDELIGQYLQGSGLSFTKDIAPTLGDQTVVATAPGPGKKAALVTKPTSMESARATSAQAALLLPFFGIEPAIEVAGDRFVLATDAAYARQLAAGDGDLGSTPRFGKAVGDLKDAAAVLYGDVHGLQSVRPTGGVPAGLAAFGLVGGQRGEEQFLRIRVVAE